MYNSTVEIPKILNGKSVFGIIYAPFKTARVSIIIPIGIENTKAKRKLLAEIFLFLRIMYRDGKPKTNKLEIKTELILK